MAGWGPLRDSEEPEIPEKEIEERARKKEQELIDDWTLPDIPRKRRDGGELELPENLRVGVIGAGFAGCAAAWYLNELGVDVVLYESSDHVGGRVLTDRKFISPKIAEAGAELIGTNHPMWRKLARDEFKLTLVPLTTEDEYERRKPIQEVRLRFGPDTLTLAQKKALKKSVLKNLNELGDEAKPIDPIAPWTQSGNSRLDRMSLSDRFDLMFPPIGAPKPRERQLLEFKIGNDNCAAPTALSYLGMLTAISAGRLGDDKPGMRGYWDFTETHRCREGNQALAKNMADKLGAKVRLNDAVARVEITQASGVDHPVKIRTVAGKEERFSYAILAVPSTVWDDISVDPDFARAARSISHGPAVKYMSRWPDRFWEANNHAPSMLWDELGSVWETTDKQNEQVPDHGLTVFSGGTFVLANIQRYRDKLKVVYPRGVLFDRDPIADELVDWPKRAGIKAGYAVPTKRQVLTVMQELTKPHLDRLFFAGEQVSVGFYGYMEGALQTGGRAARDIVRRELKVRPSRGKPGGTIPTIVPGGKKLRIRGADYLGVQVDQMFPGPAPTIAELARELHLQTDLTFHTLLGYQANAPAVIGLFRDQIGGPVPELEEARRRLRVEGTAPVLSDQFAQPAQAPYVGWRVQPDGNKPIVLPLSAGFLEMVAEGTRKRQRQTRLEAIQPELDALADELQAIHEKALELDSTIRAWRIMAESHAQEVAIVEALDGLLGALLSAPKAEVGAGDRRDVEGLRVLLGTLRSEAHQHLLIDPAESFRAGLVAERGQQARELLALVEAPAFVQHVRTLAANRDIAPPDLYGDTVDGVGFAFQALLASPESERAVDAHVRPMIDALAARPIDLDGVAARTNAALDAAIRDVPVAPPADSVLVILVGVAGVVPLAVGNYPGPNTLAVGILQWAAPHLLARVVSDPVQASAMAGRVYRALVTCASASTTPAGLPRPLGLAERVALIEAVDQGNMARLRDVDWSARFQSSPAWGAAIAVASAICLYAAVQSDDANTLRRWSNVLGSATGTALGVSVAVGRYSALVQQGIVRAAAGRALGVVGAAAAIVSGGLTAVEEYGTGDRTGMWIAIGGATGGLLSVAGFLLGAGAATTGSIGGAPVGVVLMVMGAALGIGAAIVSVVRGLTTAGAQVVFEALIEHFARTAGPVDQAANQRPSLRAALTAVRTAHHPVDFWDVHPDRTPELFDVGFGPAHIAQIVAESEAAVTNRLRVAKRVA